MCNVPTFIGQVRLPLLVSEGGQLSPSRITAISGVPLRFSKYIRYCTPYFTRSSSIEGLEV